MGSRDAALIVAAGNACEPRLRAHSIRLPKRTPRVDDEHGNHHANVVRMTGTNSRAAALAIEQSEWVQAHEALSRLAKERAAADAEEGRWLLCALRSAAHVHLGFGTFGEYIERLFGYKPRSTQEKLRVAEALEQLPAIARALEEGALNWSAVRELTRVAVPETEQEWLEVAHGKTVHQLEALVAGKIPGDRPSSPNRPDAQRHVLRFEVAPETLALFREAMNRLRRDSGVTLDDDSALMLMARQILGGPSDDGRASYQIALSVCPECGAGSQQASGELVPVGAEVVAMADCDGQRLGPIGPGKESAHMGARAKQTIPPATRRAVLHRDHHRCQVPGCRNAAFVDLHHIELVSEGGSNEADNLITLCGAHHRAVHRGELTMTGSVSRGVRFRHADGSAYGQAVKPQVAETQAKAFIGLKNLGFREGEIRRVLAELCGRGQEPDTEGILRAALARLTTGKAARV